MSEVAQWEAYATETGCNNPECQQEGDTGTVVVCDDCKHTRYCSSQCKRADEAAHADCCADHQHAYESLARLDRWFPLILDDIRRTPCRHPSRKCSYAVLVVRLLRDGTVKDVRSKELGSEGMKRFCVQPSPHDGPPFFLLAILSADQSTYTDVVIEPSEEMVALITDAERTPRTCAQCQSESDALDACTGCNKAWYCGRECRMRHYWLHALFCRFEKARELWAQAPYVALVTVAPRGNGSLGDKLEGMTLVVTLGDNLCMQDAELVSAAEPCSTDLDLPPLGYFAVRVDIVWKGVLVSQGVIPVPEKGDDHTVSSNTGTEQSEQERDKQKQDVIRVYNQRVQERNKELEFNLVLLERYLEVYKKAVEEEKTGSV